MKSRVCIDKLLVGSTLTIVGYNRVYRGYIGKLAAKGLTVGKSFELLSVSNIETVLKMSLEGILWFCQNPKQTRSTLRRWIDNCSHVFIEAIR